ncbi:MAG TPA: hypothetical protein VEL76_01450 [Gemmataceae bacterium]|nr:hypothetical protein [Gemmataceae bacterium]
MPSYYDEDEEWEAGEYSEGEDEADGDDTVPCPYCRTEVYEDTVRCPACGHYLSREDAPASRQAWWVIIGALCVLAVVAIWVFSSP